MHSAVYVVKINDLIAYSMCNTGLYWVDLKSEQPWSGVHCVCRSCVKTLARVAGSS